MLKLWYGKDIEEKSRIIMKEIHRRVGVENPKKQIILVPEQYTLETEKQFLKHTGEKGLMQVEVLSFSRLAFRVFQETGGRNHIYIDDQGIHMLLRKILKEQQKNLTVYQHMARQQGFVEALVKQINECKQFQITPEMLRQQSQMQGESDYAPGKLKDIAIIYEKMDEMLQQKYLHKEDRFEVFRKQIVCSELIKGAEFWIEGFYSFTPNMLSVLERLGENAPEINLSVYGNMNDVHSSELSLYKQVKRLESYFGGRGIEVKKSITDKGDSVCDKPADLKHLETEFRNIPVKQYDDEVRSIELFSAANDETEITWTALFIQNLVQEKGYRYKEIAVLCPDLEQRQNHIRRTMRLHQIPVYMDEKMDLRNHPLMILLLRGLKNIDQNYPVNGMMAYLKTGYAGLRHWQVEELENLCLQYGITGKKWRRNITESIPEIEDDEVEKWRKVVMDPLEELSDDLKKAENVEDITKSVFYWLEKLNIVQQIERQLKNADTRDAFEQKQVYAQLWNELINIMDQMVEMMGEAKLSLKEYIEILETGISSIEVGTIPSTLDQVFVGTIERSRLSDIKCLFFISANDGVIPAGMEDDSLLLPPEKEILALNGCELGITAEEREKQEMFYVYLAMTKPSEKLYISYSLATEEGMARRPSIIIDRLQSLFPTLEQEDDLFLTSDQTRKKISRPNSAFLNLTGEIRKLLDGDKVDPIWYDVYRWFYQAKNWSSEINKMMDGVEYHNQCKPIKTSVSEALFGNPLYASVARLEKYRKCPFSHFVQYGLKPEDRKQFEIKPLELGNLLHHALDGFADHIKRENIGWHQLKPDESSFLMERIMEPLIEEFKHGIFNSSSRYAYAGNRIKQVGKTAVKTMVQHIQKGDFVPLYHEVKFGKDELWPALVYGKTDKPLVSIEGRIDRLDSYREEENYYYRVIDYKTGKKDLSIPEVYHGLQLQLPVYLQAVLTAQQKQVPGNHYPAGMFYYQLDDPMVETNSEKIEEIRREWIKQMKLNGLTLKDKEIANAMDRTITDQSEVLPLAFKKDGDFKSNSLVATSEEFELLLQYVGKVIVRMAEEILSGNISIYPSEFNGKRACEHCDFMAICQFDQSLPDQQANFLSLVNNQEAFTRMRQQCGKKVDS